MRILITGDSFAADWTPKLPRRQGWPNWLAQKYDVTNLAQAGCSEYKIWLQLNSTDLDQYSHIIVFHTSPYRIPVETHPVHHNDVLHGNCDLIYSDIKQNGPSAVVDFFENYFHTEYAEFVHNLILEKQSKLLSNQLVFHATAFDTKGLDMPRGTVMLDHVWKKYPGNVNHLNEQGNKIIFNLINDWLQ